MSEWKETELGKNIKHKKGFAFKSNNYQSQGRLIVRVSDTTPNSINITSCVRISEENAANYSEYELSYKDVVIMTVGSWAENPASVVGKVIRVPKEAEGGLLNQNAVRIRSNGNINKDFLYYQLKSNNFARYIVNNAQGSANQASLTLDDIFSYQFKLPPSSEQQAIAEVLSSLDDKIDLLHRQNKTLEQMAETLFRQWFVEEAQEDWEVVKLGDFVETNKNTANKQYPHKIIQYLDTGSLTEGKIDSLQEHIFKKAPSRAKRLIQHNDVLVSTVRPNQKHYGIVKDPIENLVVSTGFCVITCNDIDPHFIYIFLTTADMTEYLHSIAEASTSTYPSLKPKDIEALEFQLPPEYLLQKFTDYCTSAWDKINQNQNQIRTLEKMRDTLLPKLMSGEMRLKL